MTVTYHHPLGHHSFPEPRAPTRTWFNQSHQEIRRVSLGAPALVQGLASATAQPAFPFALPWRQQAAGKGPTSCTRLLSQPQHLGLSCGERAAWAYLFTNSFSNNKKASALTPNS